MAVRSVESGAWSRRWFNQLNPRLKKEPFSAEEVRPAAGRRALPVEARWHTVGVHDVLAKALGGPIGASHSEALLVSRPEDVLAQ